MSMDLFGLMKYLESLVRMAKKLDHSRIDIPVSVADQIVEKFSEMIMKQDDLK